MPCMHVMADGQMQRSGARWAVCRFVYNASYQREIAGYSFRSRYPLARSAFR